MNPNNSDPDLVALTVLVPRELAQLGFDFDPTETYVVRQETPARFLLTSLRIATSAPEPAEQLFELQMAEETRQQRQQERLQYREDAQTLEPGLLARMYPPSRLCAMWIAGEREDREGPIEDWEREPLRQISAHVAEFHARRKRGIAAARQALSV